MRSIGTLERLRMLTRAFTGGRQFCGQGGEFDGYDYSDAEAAGGEEGESCCCCDARAGGEEWEA